MKNKQPGYITLISTLIVGAVGLSIVTAVILLGLSSSRTSFALQQSIQAKAAANACVESALEEIRLSTPFAGTGNLTFPDGSCTYAVTSTGGQGRTITGIGTVGTVTRKVRVIISAINPLINVTSWKEVANF